MAKGDARAEALTQIHELILFLRQKGMTETEVRRWVERTLNEARRGS